MVGACLNVAQSPDYKSVWNGNAPADFGTDLAQLGNDYGAVTNKAALADAATGGAADAKAVAEGVLEDTAFALARALANHFKKAGDLDRHGKVNFTKSEIVKLRMQELVTQTTAIRDLGTAAVSEPEADKRGVTAARVAALTAAIDDFRKVMSTPRGQIVNRGALLKEVETDVADLVEKVTDMDDLAVQFNGGDAGSRFTEAWKRARIIVDSGGGHSNGGTPQAPPAPAPQLPAAPPTSGPV